MKISSQGIGLIKQFEGLRLSAYRCSAGVLTIGYGHTSNVHHDLVITESQADKFLLADLVSVEQILESNTGVLLNQNQYDALASFIFNLGATHFSQSTLLKKLNAENYLGAADEFSKWINAAGKVSTGLIKRRAIEKDLFLSSTGL